MQLVAGGSGVKTVKVTYAFARAPDDLDTRLLRAMITKGIIEPSSNGSPESPLDFIQVQIANVESKFVSAISESGKIKVDQPGMIGTVGSILGEENVKVSFMSVGRIAPRKQAVMAIGVDDQPSKEALKKIGEDLAIEEFVFLKL
ncbi:d-3-phosphoglycerate dehydrogenase 1 [Quercus suber]|uniref:D-3-phosphoglycerate dehydrogenase 1 n=1 Tax=Quercus suber TaxID=58331 RepID=A0AAW0J9H3_QUESU